MGLAHLVFFNYLEMDSETKTFEKATTTETMSTDQPKNVSDDKASSNEKATSSTAPIGIYIFVFFCRNEMFFCVNLKLIFRH